MTQNFTLRKIDTIRKLTELQDEDLFDMIEQLLNASGGEDWAKQLSTAQKESIEKGIRELDAGKGEDYDDFQKRMEQKFK